ncbi:MAG: hypothetical protein WD060_05780 [Pirellulales bacterium]
MSSPAALFAASTLLVSGIEIAGDHDADRLNPTRHVEHGGEPTLDEDVVVFWVTRTPGRFLPGLFYTEELEPLVILLVTACDRREIVPPSSRKRRRSRFARGPLLAPAAWATRCGFT